MVIVAGAACGFSPNVEERQARSRTQVALTVGLSASRLTQVCHAVRSPAVFATEYDVETLRASRVPATGLREELAANLGVELELILDYSTPYQFEGSRRLYEAMHGQIRRRVPLIRPATPVRIVRTASARAKHRAPRRVRRVGTATTGPPDSDDPPPRPGSPARAGGVA